MGPGRLSFCPYLLTTRHLPDKRKNDDLIGFSVQFRKNTNIGDFPFIRQVILVTNTGNFSEWPKKRKICTLEMT